MSERTSNKQILEAINALTEAITQTMVQPKVEPQPVAAAAEASGESTIKVDAKYKAMMENKFAAYAAKVGEPVIGYAYKKSNGRTGLWSIPQSKWTGAKIKNLVGAVGIYKPAE